MSTSSRGRKVPTGSNRTSSLRIFFVVVAAVLIVGVATLITLATRSEPAASVPPTTTAPVGTVTAPAAGFDGATGVTPEGFYFKGSPDAPVTVIEYADYQCPACANFVTSSLYQRLNADYIQTNRIQYVFHDFPLPYHQLTPIAAQATYCAGDQGQYWNMHDQIFRTQQSWTDLQAAAATSQFNQFAQQLGLNMATFQSCLSSEKYLPHIQRAGQAAQAAGIPATPTFVVDGRQVNASELLPAIDAALAGQGGS